MKFSSSAPGSLMLFGEHAVLQGQQALCCALDQRIWVTLTPRRDRWVELSSSLGKDLIDLDSFVVRPPFEFVLTAVNRYRSQMSHGFSLSIHSEFSSTMGLGSSSAVTVATVATLWQCLGITRSAKELFLESKSVVLQMQGVGSGADVAAAVYGGVVAYRAEPLVIQPLTGDLPLILVYSGSKTPTRIVIQAVAKKAEADARRYRSLYEKIGFCSRQAVLAIEEKNWLSLGKLMNQHHQLLADLGVSTPLLDEIAFDLCRQPQIYGAKISGSGLGDCVVALGVVEKNLLPLTFVQQAAGVKQIPVKISPLGCRIENK